MRFLLARISFVNRLPRVAAVLAACLLAQNQLPAQTATSTSAPATRAAPAPPTGAVNAASIQARMQQIQDDKALDDTIRGKALDLYKQTLEQLRLADEWQAKVAA